MPGLFQKKTRLVGLLAVTAAVTVLFFQNCGEGFLAASGEIQLASVDPMLGSIERLPFSVTESSQDQIFLQENEAGFGQRVSVVADPEKGQVFQISGPQTLTTFGTIRVDSSKIYRVSGELKSVGITPSVAYLGVAPYNEAKEFIDNWDVHSIGSPAKIADVSVVDNVTIITTVEPLDGWSDLSTPGYMRLIGFYFDGNTAKAPDYVHIGGPGSVDAYSAITANSLNLIGALPQEVIARIGSNTVIRNQISAGGTYIYNAASNVTVGNQWQAFSGLISGEALNPSERQFRKGAIWAKIVVIANYQQDATASLRVANLTIEEVSAQNLDVQITSHLQDQTVIQGQTATFAAGVAGAQSYVWLKDGTILDGQTGPVLSLANVQANQSGTYTLRVSSATTVLETSASLAVIAPPTVLMEVGDQTAAELANIVLEARVSGQAVEYKWYKNDVLIPNETKPKLALNALSRLHEGVYRLEATNIAGSAASQGNLTVTLLLQGASLYERECTACHGPITNSSKANKTFDQIRTAMLTVPAMQARFLVGNELRLSENQIRALSVSLTPPQANAQGALILRPLAMAVNANGTVGYVVDNDSRALIRVNLANGLRSVASGEGVGTGEMFSNTVGNSAIALNADATQAYVLASAFSGPSNNIGVFRIDLANGNRVFLSNANNGAGPAFSSPRKIILNANGTLAYVVGAQGTVYRVDLANGNRTIVTGPGVGGGPEFSNILDIKINAGEASAEVHAEVQDPNLRRRRFTIDLATGNRTEIQNGNAPNGFNYHGTGGYYFANGSLLRVAFSDVGPLFYETTPVSSNQVGNGPALPQFVSTPYAFNSLGTAAFLVVDRSIMRIDLVNGNRNIVTSSNVGMGITLTNMGEVRLNANGTQAYVTSAQGIGRIDIATGNRTLISGPGIGQGPEILSPYNMDLNSNRTQAIVSDLGVNAQFKLFRVDLATGNRTGISGPTTGAGPLISSIYSVDVDPTDNFAYIVDDGQRVVTRVNLQNGDRTIISGGGVGAGPEFDRPWYGILNANATALYVADTDLDTIFSVDIATGNRTVLSGGAVGQGPAFTNPRAMVLNANGNTIYVTDGLSSTGAVVAVNVANGNRTTITTSRFHHGPEFRSPWGIHIDPAGASVFVADIVGDLLRVNLANGNKTIVSR